MKGHSLRNTAVLMLLCLVASVCSAAQWEIAAVDTSGPGRFSSLQIDAHGNVHVAYVTDDGNRYPLKYAFWDHVLQRWFTMQVAERASFCSLTLDSKQRPHISFADAGTASGSKLRYARWDGTSWIKEAIPLNSDVVGYYTSIVLDQNDSPRISFYEYRGIKGSEIRIRMRVVMRTGQFWQVMTVDPQEGSGKFNNMTSDRDGRLHLAYANVSALHAGIRYAAFDGQAWRKEIVENLETTGGEYVGHSAAVAADGEGNPHIVYANTSTPSVRYAVRSGDRWRREIVEMLAGVGYPDRWAITLDAQGRPYIAYYDAGRGLLRLAHRRERGWLVETVDAGGVGFTSSLRIHGGYLWISYADEASGKLKVARRAIEPDPAPKSEITLAAPSPVAARDKNE